MLFEWALSLKMSMFEGLVLNGSINILRLTSMLDKKVNKNKKAALQLRLISQQKNEPFSYKVYFSNKFLSSYKKKFPTV